MSIHASLLCRWLVAALLTAGLTSCSQGDVDAGEIATPEPPKATAVVDDAEAAAATTTSTEAASTTTTPTTTTTAPPTTTTAAADGADVPGGTLGYTMLTAGHSFFGPVAEHFEQFVVNAGLVEHIQWLVFEGGEGGAPEALWNNEPRRQEMQSHLATGDIDLLVLTYHPMYGGPDGYRNWINEAIGHNPDTMIAIGIPWLLNPTDYDAVSYEERWQTGFDALEAGLLDGLRAEFPDTKILTLPYGRVAVEAYLAFEAGELNAVGNLVSPTNDGRDRSSLFGDQMGHAGPFIIEAASYLWFQLLYSDATDATPTELTADHARIVELALANTWS